MYCSPSRAYALCSAQVLRTRLALCVSAVAVYGVASGEWPNAVSDLFSVLGEQSADSARVLCDVLCEMAEDVREPQLGLDADGRSRVAAYLSSQLSFVLDRLQALLSAGDRHNALRKSALTCLCSWWKNVYWQPSSVLSHPVVDSTFGALSVVELEAAAGQAVMELIRGVDEFCQPPSQRHSGFDYWDDEDGEIQHEAGQANGEAPFTLNEQQLAAQQSLVQRVVALVPMYSQMTTPYIQRQLPNVALRLTVY